MSTKKKVSKTVRPAFRWLDKYILRDALKSLSYRQRDILKKRFQDNLAIYEIASLLNLKCKEVEWFLAESLSKLRDFCLSDPAFSTNLAPSPST